MHNFLNSKDECFQIATAESTSRSGKSSEKKLSSNSGMSLSRLRAVAASTVAASLEVPQPTAASSLMATDPVQGCLPSPDPPIRPSNWSMSEMSGKLTLKR